MTTTDRPEDVANRNYYNNEMVTKRVRVTVEMDVEWREDDPDYCLSVARADGAPPSSVRVLHPRVVSADYVGDETATEQQIADEIEQAILREAPVWEESFDAGPGTVCSVRDAALIASRFGARVEEEQR